jgi:hypothetical protein
VEVAARLAVLVACGVAGGALLVLAATQERAADDPGSTPPPMGGLAPAVLGAFVLLAGGTALTGAGTLPAAAGSPIFAGAGIGLLAVAGAVTGRAALRLARAPASGRAAGASPVLLVVAWAGAALALGSWLLAVGTVAVAVLAGVRLERRVP